MRAFWSALAGAICGCMLFVGVAWATNTYYNGGANLVAFGAAGSSPNSNGGSIVNGQLVLQPADGTHPGIIAGSGSQTLAPAFTFAGNSSFGGTLGVTGLTTLTGGATIPTATTLNLNAGATTTEQDSSGNFRIDVASGKSLLIYENNVQMGAISDNVEFHGDIIGDADVRSTNGNFINNTSNNSTSLRGKINDGASAIAVKFGNANALSTAGAAVAGFYSDQNSTLVSTVFIDGKYHPNLQDGSGTVGAQTLNGPNFKCKSDHTHQTFTITNSSIASTSNVVCTVQTADATCFEAQAVPGSGSVAITAQPLCTSAAVIGCIVE